LEEEEEEEEETSGWGLHGLRDYMDLPAGMQVKKLISASIHVIH